MLHGRPGCYLMELPLFHALCDGGHGLVVVIDALPFCTPGRSCFLLCCKPAVRVCSHNVHQLRSVGPHPCIRLKCVGQSHTQSRLGCKGTWTAACAGFRCEICSLLHGSAAASVSGMGLVHHWILLAQAKGSGKQHWSCCDMSHGQKTHTTRRCRCHGRTVTRGLP